MSGSPFFRNRMLRAVIMRRAVVHTALAVVFLFSLFCGRPIRTFAISFGPTKGTVHLAVKPAQGQSYEITVSGTYVHFPSAVYVYVHFGTTHCAATFTAENSLVERQIQQSGDTTAAVLLNEELGTGLRTYGHYYEQRFWGLGAQPGTYWVCGYLMGPQGADGQPGVPPEATASVRLGLGSGAAPVSTPAHSAALSVLAFYPTTQGAFAAQQAGRGGAIPRVSSYPAGTDTVVFFMKYRHARPGITQDTVEVSLPANWGLTVAFGPNRLPSVDGAALYEVRSPITSQTSAAGKASNSHAYPAGPYQVALRVDGRVIAHTSFKVSGS